MTLFALLSALCIVRALGAPGKGWSVLRGRDSSFDEFRFPAYSTGGPDASCFFADKFTHEAIDVPVAAAWPGPGALAGCPTPADAVNLAAPPPPALVPAPHMQCLVAIVGAAENLVRTYDVYDQVMRPVTDPLREARARSSIDIALAIAVHTLNGLGHNLVIETEFALGTAPNHLTVPNHAGHHQENWMDGYDVGNCKPDLRELWGSPDYSVHDVATGRIVMVVEAKQHGAVNAAAQEQMATETLGAAAANYWGTRNDAGWAPAADYLPGIQDPVPTAGAREHVAGVVTDGDRCFSAILCGNRLDDNTVHALPFGGGRNLPAGGANHLEDVTSCAFYALVQALHASPC